MDPIQKLLQRVDGEAVGSNPSPATASRTSPLTTPAMPIAPPRMKRVFVYSDEDEDEATNLRACGGVSTGTTGFLDLPCDGDAVQVRAEVLAELAAEAAPEEPSSLPVPPVLGLSFAEDMPFHEDVLNVALRPAGPPVAAAATGGVRVREVVAPSLWDGCGGAASSGDGVAFPLRRGLPAGDFTGRIMRKRYRDGVGEAELQSDKRSGPGDESSSGHGNPDGNNNGEGEEVVDEVELQPVYDEGGVLMLALQSKEGYQLTLDEEELLEVGRLNDEERGTLTEGDAGDTLAVNLEDEENLDSDWARLDDFGDEEDEEDEEDGELDDALIVAVVEQLVRCCEADDLDPNFSREATRFLAAAKPLLSRLENNEITASEFGVIMDRDLRRFQRIYRSVNRPRDEPIIIDGVLMDM